MSTPSNISRRQFIRLAGVTATGALLAACNPPATPTSVPPTKAPPAATPTEVPAVIKPRKVTIQIDGWAVPITRELLAEPLFMDFTRQTGIEIEFVPRTGTNEIKLDESLKQAKDRLAQLG
jgi:hypothetical protein